MAECDGAMRAGMRTVALPTEQDGWIDETLEGVADACLDDLSELAGGVDDLSTPGAFWLNPALPRDANGISCDPTTGEPRSASPTPTRSSSSGKSTARRAADEGELMADEEEEDIATLLRDIDPRGG